MIVGTGFSITIGEVYHGFPVISLIYIIDMTVIHDMD